MIDIAESEKPRNQKPGQYMDKPSAAGVPTMINTSSLSELAETPPIRTADNETHLDFSNEHEVENEDKDSALPDVVNPGDEQSNEESSGEKFQCAYCDKSYNNKGSLENHLRERRSNCSKDRLGATKHRGNIFACSRCHAETSKKFSAERHINESFWKVCDECCEAGNAVCIAIYVDSACKHCLDNGLSCTKHTGPVPGVHSQLFSGAPTQPLKAGPKSSRTGKDPAAKGEAIKRKATSSPGASPRFKPVGKKDKIEHSHLRDDSTLQSSLQTQNFTKNERHREGQRAQNTAPANLLDDFSAAPLSRLASMSQTSPSQPGEHPAAYQRAPRLRPYFPNTDRSRQEGSSANPPFRQPHEHRTKDFFASDPRSLIPSRQSSMEPSEPADQPRALKGPVARELTQKVAMERSKLLTENENDPIFRIQIHGSSYDMNGHPIFSILTIRASQRFGPRLDAYCHQRNKRYGVDWIFIYPYVVEGQEHKRYIKINYDMTPLDVYDKDSPSMKLRDMDTITIMKVRPHLAAKIESDRKGVKTPPSSIGSQVSEEVVDMESGETPIYQNAGTLTRWHRLIELKMMELRRQVVALDSEVTRQKRLVAQRDRIIAEMMGRESVIQRILRAGLLGRVAPTSLPVVPHHDQTGTEHGAGPVRAPAIARPNHFMARLESVREPGQHTMPHQPMPQYRFPTDAYGPGARRPDNSASQ